MKEPRLHHFSPPEFNRGGVNWWPRMCPRLLVLIDTLRLIVGSPIHISGHAKAVGRTTGSSQHNVSLNDQVRALDFFVEGINTREAAEDVAHRMRKLGFTGIGVYPQWTNNRGVRQVGFHGDTRADRAPGDPATWGYVDGAFTSMMNAIQRVGEP